MSRSMSSSVSSHVVNIAQAMIPTPFSAKPPTGLAMPCTAQLPCQPPRLAATLRRVNHCAATTYDKFRGAKSAKLALA